MKQQMTIKYRQEAHVLHIDNVEPKDFQWPAGINERVPTNYTTDALDRVTHGSRWEKVSDDGHVKVYERDV